MPSAVSMALIPLTVRERDAQCSGCRRRGTFATVAREAESDVAASHHLAHHLAFGPNSAPPRIARYCRGCWPHAHRQLQREIQSARERSDAAFRAWVATDEPSQGPRPVRIGVGAMAVAFHWTLALGTWWREVRRGAI